MDELLFQECKSTYWRPGSGRSIATSSSYRDFREIVRTVHLDVAVEIYKSHRFQPNPLSGRSALNSDGHPCSDIKILWFGPSRKGGVDDHDSYGNIQFIIPANILVEWWEYYYLVEMETTPKHTTSRVLITNKNYSSDLPIYNPYPDGGPWYIHKGQHYVLRECLPYNNIRDNMNGHLLEFMIELSPDQERELLDQCVMSFRNHSEARGLNSKRGPPKCHIYCGILNSSCPSPLTRHGSALQFASEYRNNNSMKRPRMPDDDKGLFVKYKQAREKPVEKARPLSDSFKLYDWSKPRHNDQSETVKQQNIDRTSSTSSIQQQATTSRASACIQRQNIACPSSARSMQPQDTTSRTSACIQRQNTDYPTSTWNMQQQITQESYERPRLHEYESNEIVLILLFLLTCFFLIALGYFKGS